MKQLHHSPNDFDKRTSNWSLDSAQYVSTPTSLKLTRVSDNTINQILLHHSLSGVMEQGRIVSWWRTPYLNTLRLQCFIFRNLSPDSSAATYPFYAVVFTQMQADLRKYTAGDTYTTIKSWPALGCYPILADAWTQLRVSWWNGYNLQSQPATIVRFETKRTGDWHAFDDAYDTAQLNKDQSIQRCGVGYHGHETGVYCWCDDTEFWLPV